MKRDRVESKTQNDHKTLRKAVAAFETKHDPVDQQGVGKLGDRNQSGSASGASTSGGLDDPNLVKDYLTTLEPHLERCEQIKNLLQTIFGDLLQIDPSHARHANCVDTELKRLYGCYKISSRVKSSESISGNLKKDKRKGKGLPPTASSLQELTEQTPDCIGIRIVCYSQRQKNRVFRLINSLTKHENAASSSNHVALSSRLLIDKAKISGPYIRRRLKSLSATDFQICQEDRPWKYFNPQPQFLDSSDLIFFTADNLGLTLGNPENAIAVLLGEKEPSSVADAILSLSDSDWTNVKTHLQQLGLTGEMINENARKFLTSTISSSSFGHQVKNFMSALVSQNEKRWTLFSFISPHESIDPEFDKKIKEADQQIQRAFLQHVSKYRTQKFLGYDLAYSDEGYSSVQTNLQLKLGKLDGAEFTAQETIRFELQIRTLLEDAFAEPEHSVVYKGSLSLSAKNTSKTLGAELDSADDTLQALFDHRDTEVTPKHDFFVIQQTSVLPVQFEDPTLRRDFRRAQWMHRDRLHYHAFLHSCKMRHHCRNYDAFTESDHEETAAIEYASLYATILAEQCLTLLFLAHLCNDEDLKPEVEEAYAKVASLFQHIEK